MNAPIALRLVCISEIFLGRKSMQSGKKPKKKPPKKNQKNTKKTQKNIHYKYLQNKMPPFASCVTTIAVVFSPITSLGFPCIEKPCLHPYRYIVDIETGRDFYLSTVLYTNANGVLNDDRYEYDTAYRVTADVAEVVARALWQIPPDQSLSATCLDGIPSGFWGKTSEASERGGGRIVAQKAMTGLVQPSTNEVIESSAENDESGREGKEFSDAMSVGAGYMVKHAEPAVSPVHGGVECVKKSSIVFVLPLGEFCDTPKKVGVAEWTLLPNETTKNFEDFATLDPMSATFDQCDNESKHAIVCGDGALKRVELGSVTNVEFKQICNIDGAGNEVVDTCENFEEVEEQVGPPRLCLMPFYRYFVDE